MWQIQNKDVTSCLMKVDRAQVNLYMQQLQGRTLRTLPRGPVKTSIYPTISRLHNKMHFLPLAGARL